MIVDVLARNMDEIGLPIDHKIIDTGFAATDMGNVSQKIPAIHPIIRLGRICGQHSKEFAEACDGENGYRVAGEMAMSLALTGIELLQNPRLLAEAREELDQRTGY